ncbi:MAG: hypothetical protein NTZ42_01635 [Candidatus Gribaldobacteria bacterium]|nr:hypothetical protein [Candidatus Gribaldobacteria bacterium]
MQKILIIVLLIAVVALSGVIVYQKLTPTETNPVVVNQPANNQPTTNCGKEGVIFYNPDDTRNICCAGLQAVYTQNTYYADGQENTCALGATPRNVVCTACGNGVCGKGENQCNCPADCK